MAAREKIFGNISGLVPDHEPLADWFNKFNLSLDELEDKEFLTKAIAELCPCQRIMMRAKIFANLLPGWMKMVCLRIE